MREYVKNIRKQLKPKYHELTAYLTALTCAALFLFRSEFRAVYVDYFKIQSGPEDVRASIAFFVLGSIVTIGFFLSFIHVFIKDKKSWFDKTCIGTFILGTNGLAGIVAGLEMLPSQWSILMIVPLWNILTGIILLYQIGLQKFDISDENASPLQVFGSSITLLIVFFITNFVFHFSWAMTLSICLFYSSTIFFFASWMIDYFRYQWLPRHD